MSDRFFEELNMGKVIQIDGRSDLVCKYKFLCRCVIGGKHDLLAFKMQCVREHKLCEGRTVASASVLF